MICRFVNVRSVEGFNCKSGKARIPALILALWLASHARSTTAFGAEPAKAQLVGFGPVPAWVKQVSADPKAQPEPGESGYAYLLADRQTNLSGPEFFFHEVRKITSSSGVKDGAILTTTIEPAFERVIFHRITRTRDGVTTNGLDRSGVELYSRQTDSEHAAYDRGLTLQYQLGDVHVGDVIEFAYTFLGTNPVKRQKFYTTSTTQWSVAMGRCVTRIIFPSARHVRSLPRNRTIPPVTISGGMAEWMVDDVDLPARAPDSDCPADYDPRSSVLVSEFDDWAEVAARILPFFRVENTSAPAIRQKIDMLRAVPDEDERVVSALAMVQNEIRDVSFDTTSNVIWRMPTPFEEIVRRRFADSKDKALLLVALLRGSGVGADAALVSSNSRAAILDFPPSPGVFDQVIVCVRTKDGIHWLDPTRDHQRGPLSQIYISPFGAALLVSPQTRALTKLEPPPDSLPRKRTVEKYRVPAPEGTGDLDVVTEFWGAFADDVRKRFDETSREQIQKNYTEFYARRFPEITARLPVAFEEIADADGCRVRESYFIPKIWTLKEDKKSFQLWLHPSEIDHAMELADSTTRKDPFALDGPGSVTQQIEAEMFEEWPFEIKNSAVENAWFRFHDEPKADGAHIELHYQYDLLTDRVAVVDLAKYNSTLDELKDTLGYRLTYTTPRQLKTGAQWRGVNWSIGLWDATITAVVGYIGYRYFRLTRLPSPRPPPLPPHDKPGGIRGWLILVAIGLVITLVSCFIDAVSDFAAVLNLERWQALTTPGQGAYHPMWAPALLFDMISNSLGFMAALLVLLLFFGKRAAWPRAGIALLIFLLIASIINVALMWSIPEAATPLAANRRAIIAGLIGALIWIPYILRSKRVKATFRY